MSAIDAAHALDVPVAAQSARDPSAELEWLTPADSGCSTREQIESRVVGLTSRGLAPPESASGLPRIRVELAREEPAWRAEIRAIDADGRTSGARELSGKSPDCRSLDVALALVIATLLDALPGPAAVSGPAAGSAETAAHSGGPPAAEGGVGLSLASRAGIGLISKPVFGLNFGVELPVPGASVVIDGSAYLPYDDLDARGRGARLWMWHAGLGYCPRLASGVVTLQLCGGAQLGAIHASGRGLDSSATRQRLLVLAGLEPRLGIRLLDRLGLQLSVLGAWAAIRPKFTLDRGGPERETLGGAPFVLLLRIGIIGFLR